MRSLIITTILVLLGISGSLGQEVYAKKGIANEGYDLVSYFDGTPQKGSKAFAYSYMDVSYHFSSKVNLEKFKANPTAYLPEYGGFCAYAVAKTGDKVSVNPKTFEIRDGKLYLFYNSWGNNTLNKWLKDPEALKEQADANWQNQG